MIYAMPQPYSSAFFFCRNCQGQRQMNTDVLLDIRICVGSRPTCHALPTVLSSFGAAKRYVKLSPKYIPNISKITGTKCKTLLQ